MMIIIITFDSAAMECRQGGEEEKEEEEEEEAKVHLIGLNDINTAAISTEAVLINNAPALPIGVN